MEKTVEEKLRELLDRSSLSLSDENKIFYLKEVDDLFELEIIEEKIVKNKLVSNKIFKEKLNFEELVKYLEVNNLLYLIDREYEKYLDIQEKISAIYENVIKYLINLELPKEDKDMLLEIINIAYKYGYINFNLEYGLTFINPLTNEVKLELINLRNINGIDDIDEIFTQIIQLYHKNRVKFQKNIEFFNNYEEKDCHHFDR